MPLPSFDGYLLITLKTLESKKILSLKEIDKAFVSIHQLTDEDINIRMKNGVIEYSYKIRWALTHLFMAKLVERPQRSHYKITQRGLDIINNNISVDTNTLMEYEEYRYWVNKPNHTPKNHPLVQGILPQALPIESPEEMIERSVNMLTQSLSLELLETIKTNSPAFFEKLVVDLMLAMGYGGSVEDAGQSIGQSGDGGIDGVIKEDRLGLSNIYLQAKRWEGTVGRPVIQAFAGALMGRHATRGVFITTSKFSAEAIDYAHHLPQPIILIDGEKLVQLMIEYNVGVTTRQTYEVKRLDLDYFSEDE